MAVAPADGRQVMDTTMVLRLQMSGELCLRVDGPRKASRDIRVANNQMIGNDPSADIYLDDPLVCLRHARIEKDGNWWKVKDLKSENGTFVNDNLIDASVLFPDSVIVVGNTRITVSYAEPPKIETAIVRRSGEWVQLPRIIAHELKNYLQFFDAGVEQLKQDSDVFDRFHGEITSLEMAGEKMDDLVQMLRAGCAEPHFSDVNLVEILWEQLALIEGSAQKNGLVFDLDIPDNPLIITADSNQLGRAILNILKNAMEACSQDGTISVIVNCMDNRISVQIRDTGHGMDMQTLEAMWNPMFTTRPQGNGLGAFIARTAVCRHNGQINAQSKVGKVTVINIELPRNQA